MRTPDKNRFLRAIKHIESEEVPFFEPGPDPAVVSRVLGRDVPMAYSGSELPPDVMVDYSRAFCNDMAHISNFWRLGRKTMLDSEGRHQYIDGEIKTPADLKKVVCPDLDDIRIKLNPDTLGRIHNIPVGRIRFGST